MSRGSKGSGPAIPDLVPLVAQRSHRVAEPDPDAHAYADGAAAPGGRRGELFAEGEAAGEIEGLALALDDEGIERTVASTRSLPVRAAATERPWPTGVSPSNASIDLDASEVALTAEYPPAPASFLTAVTYFASVLLRRRALGARVRELNDELTDAERTRDGLLVAMMDALRPALLASSEGAKLLDYVLRIEQLAAEKRAGLMGANDEFQHASAELDRQEQEAATARDTNARDAELAEAVLAERTETQDRLEARKKRLYIEIRSVLDAVEKAGGLATDAQNAELASCESQVAAQKPEIERAAGEVEVARAKLEAVLDTGKEIARRLRDIERRRSALVEQARKDLGAQSQSLSDAETHRTEAVVEAARGVLAAKGRLAPVPEATLDAIRAADVDVEARVRELTRYVRALDAYDVDGMKQGAVVLAVAFVAFLLVVGYLLGR